MDVGSAGDDLEGLISHVHLADHQLVCVGMAVDGKDLAYYDLFKIFVKTLEAFYLCSGQGHGVGVFLGGHVQVWNICFYPG